MELFGFQCCQCVRNRHPPGSDNDDSSRPIKWDEVREDDEQEESGGDTSPAHSSLPRPSSLLEPTSKLSMEPIAVRDKRSWPYAAPSALRPLLRFPPLGAIDFNASVNTSVNNSFLPMPHYQVPAQQGSLASLHLPPASLQLPVELGVPSASEQQARQLMRTGRAPRLSAAVSGQPRPQSILAPSMSVGSSCIASSSQVRSVSPPIVHSAAALRSASAPAKPVGKNTRKADWLKATVGFDTNRDGQIDYLYTGYDGDQSGIPVPVPRMVYLPIELRAGKVLVEEATNKWRATNSHLEGKPGGLRYRASKNLDDLVDGVDEGVAFGELLTGFDEGDGWVRIELAQEPPAQGSLQAAQDVLTRMLDTKTSSSGAQAIPRVEATPLSYRMAPPASVSLRSGRPRSVPPRSAPSMGASFVAAGH